MDKKITMMLPEIMDAITSNKFKKTVFNAVAPEDENIFVFGYHEVYLKAFVNELRIKIETGEMENIADEFEKMFEKWYNSNQTKLQEISKTATEALFDELKKLK